MRWTSKYCFLLYLTHPYCPSQVRPTEDLVTSYNYTVQNRRAYSRTTPSILGVARPRARPIPKQLGVGIVDGAVTPLCRMKNNYPAPYSNSTGQGFGQGLLPRRLHTICCSTVNRLGRTSSGKHGVFLDGDANELLPDSSTAFTQAGCSS